MPGLGRNSSVSGAVVSGMSVNVATPVPTAAPSSTLRLVDKDSASFWAVVWFVFALVMLYIIL